MKNTTPIVFGIFTVFFLFPLFCHGQVSIITTVAGNGIAAYGGDGGPAIYASLNSPNHIALDTLGNLYIPDYYNLRVRKVSNLGVITTIAGTGAAGSTGDGGLATAATFHAINGVAVDNMMNVYIADEVNQNVRKVNAAGIINILAGTWAGSARFGDGVSATTCPAGFPKQVAVDRNGNVYFVANAYHRIRRVDTSGIIWTLAGVDVPGSTGGFSGDGGPATAAHLWQPTAACLDKWGNAYIADWGNQRIRKVDTFGNISTFAGNGSAGFSGDGGAATSAKLCNPVDVAVDDSGNVYIADQLNNRIRKVDLAGIITTIAGAGTAGYLGDGGPALCAHLNGPLGLAIAKNGDIFVADANNNRVRKISSHPLHYSDSLTININRLCSGPEISIVTRGYTSSLRVITWFGDGDTLTSAIANCGVNGVATVTHAYPTTGTYTIKHVMYSGAAALDSISYSYDYALCNSYSLKFYSDVNSNCLKDDSESFSGYSVTLEVDSNSVPIDTISALGGVYYSAFGAAGDLYSFRLLSAPAGLAITCPASGIIVDTIQMGMYSSPVKYFGFGCSAAVGYDLAGYTSRLNGRHAAKGTIVINNDFCTPASSRVTLHFSPRYVYESAYPTPDTVIGNSIIWSLGNVASTLPSPPVIGFTLKVPGTWITPGDTVNSICIADPTSGDIDTANNVILRSDTVKSSFDPNDIEVSPAGNILPGCALQYTIHFENTGNDTAHNIYIMDTLSQNLEPRSLRAIAASGVVNTSIIRDSIYCIAKFDFPNIRLLDSSHHNQCDGFVIFNVNTRPNLPDSEGVYNSAGIFFDDNPVVLTNAVLNRVALIHGDSILCIGRSDTLTDLATGGVWHVSNTHATISSSGVLTGVSTGNDTITYSVAYPNGIISTRKVININPRTNPGFITGPDSVCAGVSASYIDTVGGGIWSSVNSRASITSSGVLTGVSAGWDTIIYRVSGFCNVDSTSKRIVINPLPYAGAINAPDSLCVGAAATLFDSITAGYWVSSNGRITIAGDTAIGVAYGLDTIYHVMRNSCGVDSSHRVILVKQRPNAGVISCNDSICVGTTVTIRCTVIGGIWHNANSCARLAGVLLSGYSAGADTILYCVSNWCGTDTASLNVHVIDAPVTPTVLGDTYLCVGRQPDTLVGTPPGGAWACTNTNASVVSGIVTGHFPGRDTISYRITNLCGAKDTIFTVVILSSAECDTATVVNMSLSSYELALYPNPTDDKMVITTNGQIFQEIQVIDCLGSLVQQVAIHSTNATISLKSFPSGVYFLKLIGNGIVTVRRVYKL